MYESLIFLSWSLTLIHLVLALQTRKRWIGCVTAPTVLLVYGFASFYLPNSLQQISPLIPALKSNWLIMHVTVMLFSYAALLMGCLLSVAFCCISALNHYSSQKIKNLTDYRILTSISQNISKPFATTISYKIILNYLDNYSYRLIGLGFPFLTIGILSGAVWANEAWGAYWSWDPKETWAFITWLVFAIYLHTRYMIKWSGLKSCIIASMGFFVIWFCYLGVNLLAKGLHSYGWFT